MNANINGWSTYYAVVYRIQESDLRKGFASDNRDVWACVGSTTWAWIMTNVGQRINAQVWEAVRGRLVSHMQQTDREAM